MSSSTTPAVDPQVAQNKALRLKFGVSMAPIAATRVYRKPMDFDHKNVDTQSWILITPDNKIVRANSYDGNLKKNYDAKQFTHEVPLTNGEIDEKALTRKLKGYTQVEISECPFATAPATAE